MKLNVEIINVLNHIASRIDTGMATCDDANSLRQLVGLIGAPYSPAADTPPFGTARVPNINTAVYADQPA